MNRSILFITSYLEKMSLDLYRRVQKCALKHGKTVLCYCGGPAHDGTGQKTSKSRIYDFVKMGMVEGVIINAGAIGQYSPVSFFEEYLQRFQNIPVVSLSYPVNAAVNISVDNYGGIYDLVEHLIVDHQYQNIGFVKGPDGHPEADERFKAYTDALKKHGIPLRQNLIAPGDFSEEAGVAAVGQFLNSADKVEAIACVDDDSALGVYSELKKRNIKCPGEIAVTGFDDIQSAEKLIPSLTTVAQPFDSMIEQAFELIQNRNKEDRTISTIGVRRESCGCRDKAMLNAGQPVESVSDFVQTRDLIGKSALPVSESWNQRLLNALDKDLNEEQDFAFVDELSVLMEETDNFSIIHDVVSDYHRVTPVSPRSIAIFQQTRVFVNQISNRLCTLDRINYENLTGNMNHMVSEITNVKTREELFDMIISGLPQFGCDECHLVELDGDQAHLFFSFKDGHAVTRDKQSFPAASFLPEGVLSSGKGFVVLPLAAAQQAYGYGIYAVKSGFEEMLDAINIQIGGVINRLKLENLRHLEQQQLTERNTQIQDLISPMLDAIKLVAEESKSEIEKMTTLQNMAENSKKKFNETLEMLNLISKKINNVMRSVSVINDISENINVLAINTSIQSAHAGHFGKAFGVIAKEIRKLSDSTAQNAHTISEDLNGTIKEFAGFKSNSETNVESFNNLATQIDRFMDVFNNTSSRMDELSMNSLNIMEIMNRDN